MPEWLDKLWPILALLAAVAVVLWRLPRVEGLPHDAAFRRRRVLNWLPLGLCYAFLYMGRYNLTVAKDALGPLGLMDNEQFGAIFGTGTFVYGFAFLLNGPLTDRFGGKAAILAGAGGSLLCNGLLGVVAAQVTADGARDTWVGQHLQAVLTVIYGANMYFQSFGAVAIVKCNAPWFHVRERGVFGAIFGILISLGIYFAFDWGLMIRRALPLQWLFWVPAIVLAVHVVLVAVLVRDTPGQAGHADFDTGDAAADGGHELGPVAVFRRMLTNPIILTIAGIEFCSGFLRQAVMQWYRTYCVQVGTVDNFVYENWGMLLCVAGILGGVLAGTISDHVFHSRRGPVAAILYAAMLLLAGGLVFTYTTPLLGALVVVMSLCVIGVHGMLSGTASMDFAGRRNTGIAVGIIDGFVYAGTGVMALTYGALLPEGPPASADPARWIAWPVVMVPVALVGLVLASRLWNARPR